jgi:hypothetical protein
VPFGQSVVALAVNVPRTCSQTWPTGLPSRNEIDSLAGFGSFHVDVDVPV